MKIQTVTCNCDIVCQNFTLYLVIAFLFLIISSLYFTIEFFLQLRVYFMQLQMYILQLWRYLAMGLYSSYCYFVSRNCNYLTMWICISEWDIYYLKFYLTILFFFFTEVKTGFHRKWNDIDINKMRRLDLGLMLFHFSVATLN